MTILKNKNYNVFLKEFTIIISILLISLIPWIEFLNSNYSEISVIINDNFIFLIILYFLVVLIFYYLIKLFFKNNNKIYYISTIGISLWIFFQFNFIKNLLDSFFHQTFLWHFLSEISLFLIFIVIISSFYFLKRKINLSYFVLFFLIFNFIFSFTILFPKLINLNIDTYEIKKEKLLNLNINKKERPNIYYFISDAMKPLNEFENFYKISLDNFKNIFENYNYINYQRVKNPYKWTEPSMTAFFSLEKEIYTDETKNLDKKYRILKSNIGKSFPTLLKKEYNSELINELYELGYDFKWVGNYSQNCSQTNYSYCLDNKRESYIDLYTLQAFLSKSPIIQIFDNILGLSFIKNNFKMKILHSDAIWEINNYLDNNKKSINEIRPTFFFIHEMEAHEPYFVDSDCNFKRFKGKFNLDGYKNSYLCVIKKMSQVIKTIDKFDPEAIVVFQSDHNWIMSTRDESKFGYRNSIFSLIKNNEICKKEIPNNPNNLNTIKYFINCLKEQ